MSFTDWKIKSHSLEIYFHKRLELIAATLSVKVSLLLRRELEIPISKEYFWTGFKVKNSKKFKIFVANRIQFIRKIQSKAMVLCANQ